MQVTDIHNPGERKKLILALALGIIALLFLWWTFFGFGRSSKSSYGRSAPSSAVSPGSRTAVNRAQPETVDDIRSSPVEQLRPIVYAHVAPIGAEAKRNIFAYYEKPPPPPPAVATSTPTPTPPVLLAAVSPANVYARTDDFTLDVTGDKFTPEVRITIDGRELATRFVGPQQLSALVPAAVIANAGGRQVIVRSPDGRLYSNAAMLNVSPPPTPNFTYVGIIGTHRRLDTAILLNKGTREILNAQRGDLVDGRFRLTSISDKELVLVDTNLKIKHIVPFSTDHDKSGPQPRPTPKVDAEDDEP